MSNGYDGLESTLAKEMKIMVKMEGFNAWVRVMIQTQNTKDEVGLKSG